MTKVYVVYANWGYEGCTEPYAVFTEKAKAALCIIEHNGYWKNHAKIAELEIDDPPKEIP